MLPSFLFLGGTRAFAPRSPQPSLRFPSRFPCLRNPSFPLFSRKTRIPLDVQRETCTHGFPSYDRQKGDRSPSLLKCLRDRSLRFLSLCRKIPPLSPLSIGPSPVQKRFRASEVPLLSGRQLTPPGSSQWARKCQEGCGLCISERYEISFFPQPLLGMEKMPSLFFPSLQLPSEPVIPPFSLPARPSNVPTKSFPRGKSGENQNVWISPLIVGHETPPPSSPSSVQTILPFL